MCAAARTVHYMGNQLARAYHIARARALIPRPIKMTLRIRFTYSLGMYWGGGGGGGGEMDVINN